MHAKWQTLPIAKKSLSIPGAGWLFMHFFIIASLEMSQDPCMFAMWQARSLLSGVGVISFSQNQNPQASFLMIGFACTSVKWDPLHSKQNPNGPSPSSYGGK